MEQWGAQRRTIATNILESKGQDKDKQKTQHVLLCLVQTSPENFANWSYKIGTIICSQKAKVWVASDKIFGLVWSIHQKEHLKPPTQTTRFLNVTTVNTQSTRWKIYHKY